MSNSNIEVHFSSKSDEYESPKDLFDYFDNIYHFQLDAAATKDNALCENYFTKENSALDKEWSETNWLNCPYSRGLQGKFIKKAYEESLKGKIVVMLLPARTETKVFSTYCSKASEIIFIIGRLKFVNKSFPSYRKDGNYKLSSAPFPSSVIIFDNSKKEQKIYWKKFDIKYNK